MLVLAKLSACLLFFPSHQKSFSQLQHSVIHGLWELQFAFAWLYLILYFFMNLSTYLWIYLYCWQPWSLVARFQFKYVLCEKNTFDFRSKARYFNFKPPVPAPWVGMNNSLFTVSILAMTFCIVIISLSHSFLSGAKCCPSYCVFIKKANLYLLSFLPSCFEPSLLYAACTMKIANFSLLCTAYVILTDVF